MIYSTLVTVVSKFIDFTQNYICECKFIKILSLKFRITPIVFKGLKVNQTQRHISNNLNSELNIRWFVCE